MCAWSIRMAATASAATGRSRRSRCGSSSTPRRGSQSGTGSPNAERQPMPTRIADWYFDFISPFAYLQSEQLERLHPYVQIRYRPVLFAGLLKHWGQKGPAEIVPKRQFTFEFALWQAAKLGIPFKMPPAHPFNPLA